jgi:alcohol dehydrogenase class IV
VPNLPAKLAMFESDVPPAERWREKSPGQLAGPQRGGADSPFPPRSLAEFHAPEIVFGPGALTELGHCAGRLGARRPFLVTDPGLIEAGWADEALAYLRQHGLRATAWHDVTPNPKNSEIEAGFERYAESGGDVIIGLGGSCIDAAKRLAALGVSQDMLPQLARTTLKDACLTTNPREAGAGDIEALFRAAL